MKKRKNFESFVKAYQNFDAPDFMWDNDNFCYRSPRIQKMYEFYSDVYEYDIGYKITIIKALGATAIAIGLIFISIISANYLSDFFITILTPPVNNIISFLITLIFMSVFFVYFTVYLHRMFDHDIV